MSCFTHRTWRLPRRALALICVAFTLAACTEPPDGQAGRFAPEAFFDGESFSRGTVTSFLFFTEPFTATFVGRGSPERLELDETFSFEDGKRLQRWSLEKTGPASYRGTVRTETGDGVLREPLPVDGRLTANGAILDYDGYAPGGGDLVLHFTHRMEALPDGTVSNDVRISKFGVPLATSNVVFAKSLSALGGG